MYPAFRGGARAALLFTSSLLLARPALSQQPTRPDSARAAAPDTTRRKYQPLPGSPHLPWYRG